ncbi:Nn.00g061280.m01.CDS01 [Neocucurbitaria sp. VM-36]
MTFHVDTYYVNIGIGDCAFHLLINDDNNTIEKLMVVDTGDSKSARFVGKYCRPQHVLQTWNRIRTYYQNVPMEPQIDVLVITHLDSDHWGSCKELVGSQIGLQVTDNMSDEEIADLRIAWFKYEENVPNKVPLTEVVAPLPLTTHSFGVDAAPQGAGCQSFLKFFWESADGSGREVCVTKMARFRSGAEWLLGLNLFNITKGCIPWSEKETITSPAHLITANPPITSQPGAYIICADWQMLGETGRAPIGTVNVRNRTSIGAMIMWNTTPVRISHYFAGDLEAPKEILLAKWIMGRPLNDPIADSDVGPVRVTSMKASHHGASSSTPMEMLLIFNPRRIIFSCGTKHGHPRWETIFNLYSWLLGQSQAFIDSKPVYSTRHPYWIIRDDNNNTIDQQTALTWFTGASDNSPHIQWLQRMYAASHNEDKNPWLMFKNQAGGLNNVTARDFLFSIAEQYFDEMSNVKKDTVDVIASTYNNAHWTTLTRGEEVEFVLVRSANDDSDGNTSLLARFLQNDIGMELEDESGFDTEFHIHIPASEDLEEEVHQEQESGFGEETSTDVYIPLQTSDLQQDGIGQEQHILGDQLTTMSEISMLEAAPIALEAAEPDALTSAMATELQTSAPTGGSLPGLSTASAKGESFVRYGRQVFVPYLAARANSASKTDTKPNTVVAKRGTYTVAPGTDPNEMDPNDLLPIPPVVVPTPDPIPPITPPESVFLLLSSKLLASGKERIHVYSEARVDNFIDALHSGTIAFQNPLSTDQASSILNTDEWYCWLQLAFGKIDKFSASLDKDRTISEIVFALSAGYQFTTRSANAALNGSILAPLKPTVSSAQVTHLGQSITPDGFLEAQNMLILGLDANAPQAFATLNDVVNFLDLSYLSKSVVMKCIGGLNLALAPKGRNAIWFSPEQGYKTTMRLEFGLAPRPSALEVAYIGLDAVKELLAFLQVGVTDVSVIAKAEKRWTGTSRGMAALNKSELVLLANCTIPKSQFLTILEFRQDSIILTARINEAGFLKAFADWLMGLLKIKSFDFDKWMDNVAHYVNLPELRRITMQLSLNTTGPDAGKVSGVQSVSLDMEATWKGSETEILFLLTYDWSSGGISRLRGSLWNKPPDDLILSYAPLLPEWEEYRLLFPLNKAAYNSSLDLKKVWPDLSNIPQGLPTVVTQAGIDICSEGFRFSGAITCDKVGSEQGAPRISLGKVALDAGYLLASPTNPKSSWYMGVVVDIGLLAQSGSKWKLPAQLRGVLLYDSGSKSWSLTGSATELRMAHLASYFDQESISPVMEVMDEIEIKYLELTYNIQPKEAGGNNFTFTGIILFGALELDLFFTYQKAEWTFDARLVAPNMISGSSSTTVGQLYTSVTGSEPDLLPSFLSDITVTRPDADRNAIGISCAKTSQQAIFFVAYARIVGLGLAFVQYKPAAGSGSTKRIIKASLSQFPILKVPLIGDLPQLFEEAYFLWVQDTSQVADASLKGITRAELVDINSVVINPEPNVTSDPNTSSNKATGTTSLQAVATTTTESTKPTGNSASGQQSAKPDASFTLNLLFKEPKKPTKPTTGENKPTGNPNDIVIQAGWHFVVVMKTADGGSEVAIDYVFGAKEKSEKQAAAAKEPAANQPSSSKPGVVRPAGANTSGEDKTSANGKAISDGKASEGDKPQAQGSGDVKKDPFKKTIGPLSISNVGFSYAKDTLSIIVDATLALGPVELSLLGFQIGIHFDKGITLQNLPSPDKFQIDLAGLAVGFDKAPVTIAGRFLHTSTQAQDFFAGGVVVAFQPWMFQAAGFYADNKATETVPAYKSVFVFAKLTGPLISFGFAEISGITGAFGYNVQLRLPSVSEVRTFPFVASPDSQSPEDALANLVGGDDAWAVPSLGSMWLAAGLKVTAFQVLAIDAVIVIQWAPVVKLGIFGVGVCDVPNSKAKKKFAHVELGLLCTVDPSAGVFKVEAQLSPNSYILDPSCHLTGGFALYSWWKPDQPQLEGQANNQTDGDWVFTIGGYHPAFKPPPQYPSVDRLKISWSLDDSLSITGEAYFAVTPKVCMGGGRLHAALSLGPLRAWFDAYVDFMINYQPFYFIGDGGLSVGVAYDLDLWLVSIHIQVEIGATLHIEGPPVAGFVHVNFWVFGFDVKFGTRNQKPDVQTLEQFYGLLLQSSTGSSNASKPHVYSCARGLVSPNSTTAPTSDDPWRVTGGVLQIAISCKVAFYTVTINGKRRPKLGDSTPLYGKPMQLTDQLTKSELTITIQHPGSDDPEWQFSKTTTALPRALWEKYDENDDPLITSQLSNLLVSTDVSMNLTNGLSIRAPEPEVSHGDFAKFDATKAAMESVYDPDEKLPETQAYTVVGSAWDPANQPESERWTLVKDAWTKVPEATSNLIVNVWREALGWSAPTDVDPMDGKKPSLLLDDFDNLYIKPPLILISS